MLKVSEIGNNVRKRKLTRSIAGGGIDERRQTKECRNDGVRLRERLQSTQGEKLGATVQTILCVHAFVCFFLHLSASEKRTFD